MMKTALAQVRKTRPLIHCMTNYVTANDCANILLACGASPVMAEDIGEVAEITRRCAGLTLNLGTLSQARIPAMILAGQTANQFGIPVVLDPVGVGASALRKQTARQLLEWVQFSVIRGNVSEIKALARGCEERGCIDADTMEQVTEERLEEALALAEELGEKAGAVVAMTGPIDIVAGQGKAYCIRNGDPMMSSVTGTGCQLSALTTAFVGANREHIPEATAAALCAMGLAGEIARTRLSGLDGSAAYRGYLIDAIYNLTPEQLEAGAKYDIP